MVICAARTTNAAATDASACPVSTPPVCVPSSYVANAIDLDGTNDYYTRASDLSGSIDGKKGVFNGWFKINGGDGSLREIISHNGGSHILIGSGNQFTFIFRNSVAAQVTAFFSTTAYLASDNWINVMAAWDAALGIQQLFINDVDDHSAGTNNDDVIDYTRGAISVFALNAGGNKYNGCASEIYYNLVDYIDISVQSNRDLVRDCAGRPENIGAMGNLLTGNQPALFLNGDGTNFHTNQGNGGDFVEVGDAIDCLTSPSD